MDISIGTFYNYFANKEELFIKIYDEFASMIFSAHNEATESNIEDPFLYIVRGITTALLMYKKYKREAIMLRVKEVGSNKLFEKKVAQFTENSYLGIKNMLENFMINNKIKVVDSEKTAICYVSSINGIILYMLKNDVEQKISNLAIPLICYNLNAIGIHYNESVIEIEIDELQRKFNQTNFKNLIFGGSK